MAKKKARSSFYFLRLSAGFGNIEQAAEWCGVTPRTIRAWDKDGAPVLVERLFQLISGDLGTLHADWRGFKLQKDRLIGPGKIIIRPEELRWLPTTRNAFEATKMELSSLKQTPWFRLHRVWRTFKTEFSFR